MIDPKQLVAFQTACFRLWSDALDQTTPDTRKILEAMHAQFNLSITQDAQLAVSWFSPRFDVGEFFILSAFYGSEVSTLVHLIVPAVFQWAEQAAKDFQNVEITAR